VSAAQKILLSIAQNGALIATRDLAMLTSQYSCVKGIGAAIVSFADKEEN
jgi:hypothetical protein